jgi:2-iminobutanoate/2-iminopropanoate deaminase
MARTPVTSPTAPKAAGPYSQAVVSGDYVFLSGQTPIDPGSGTLVEGSLAEQTQRCFDNLGAVLDAAELGFGDVVKVNVYLTSMADFAEMNETYARQFEEPYPARTTVAVAALPLGARIEIELVARRK